MDPVSALIVAGVATWLFSRHVFQDALWAVRGQDPPSYRRAEARHQARAKSRAGKTAPRTGARGYVGSAWADAWKTADEQRQWRREERRRRRLDKQELLEEIDRAHREALRRNADYDRQWGTGRPGRHRRHDADPAPPQGAGTGPGVPDPHDSPRRDSPGGPSPAPPRDAAPKEGHGGYATRSARSDNESHPEPADPVDLTGYDRVRATYAHVKDPHARRVFERIHLAGADGKDVNLSLADVAAVIRYQRTDLTPEEQDALARREHERLYPQKTAGDDSPPVPAPAAGQPETPAGRPAGNDTDGGTPVESQGYEGDRQSFSDAEAKLAAASQGMEDQMAGMLAGGMGNDPETMTKLAAAQESMDTARAQFAGAQQSMGKHESGREYANSGHAADTGYLQDR